MSEFQGELLVQQNHVPAAVQPAHVPVVLAPETNQDIPEWGMQSSLRLSTIIEITVNDLEAPSVKTHLFAKHIPKNATQR